MVRMFVAASIGFLLMALPVEAKTKLPPAATVVPPLPMGTEVRPISFERMASSIGRGAAVGVNRFGLLCLKAGNITWRGKQNDIKTEDFDDAFAAEVEDAGFKIAGGRSLFEDPESTDYAVGGTLKKLNVDICRPLTFDPSYYKGSADVEVEWQVYSKLDRKVVATITTGGSFLAATTSSDGDAMDIVLSAFAESSRKLLASEEFRSTVIGAARKPEERVLAKAREPLMLVGAIPNGSKPISEAMGSVVTILTGDGLGSGFLVSNDGYLLTNHHVVGNSTYVKVRWSDGFETLGEVVRSDKGRDVALVKTDPRGRSPLALRLGSLPLGETVYALGAPRGMENTVTKGIASANRIMDGFSYIQSDAAVSPGNSGGPLLDERSNVVAITVMTRTDAQNLNFFIPIADALDFLTLKFAPATGPNVAIVAPKP